MGPPRVLFASARLVSSPAVAFLSASGVSVFLATKEGRYELYDLRRHRVVGAWSAVCGPLAVQARSERAVLAIEAQNDDTFLCEYVVAKKKVAQRRTRLIAGKRVTTAAVAACSSGGSSSYGGGGGGGRMLTAVHDELLFWSGATLTRRLKGAATFWLAAISEDLAAAATTDGAVLMAATKKAQEEEKTSGVQSWRVPDVTQLAISSHGQLVVVRRRAVDVYDGNSSRSFQFPSGESLRFVPHLGLLVDRRRESLEVFDLSLCKDTPVHLASQPLSAATNDEQLVEASPPVPPYGLQFLLLSHGPGTLLELTVRPRFRLILQNWLLLRGENNLLEKEDDMAPAGGALLPKPSTTTTRPPSAAGPEPPQGPQRTQKGKRQGVLSPLERATGGVL